MPKLKNDEPWPKFTDFRGGGGGGEYSHILAIRVCAAGKGMVFKPFSLVEGLVITKNWSSIGSRLTGLLTKY